MKTIKTIVVSAIIGMIIGAGLVYDNLSRDLLDCRLALEQTEEFSSEE